MNWMMRIVEVGIEIGRAKVDASESRRESDPTIAMRVVTGGAARTKTSPEAPRAIARLHATR